MRIVKVISVFFICFLFLTFFSFSSFAQLDKSSCQEILGSVEINEFRQISIVTHVLTTDSTIKKPAVSLGSPFLDFIFKENYIVIESKNSKNVVYLPYNRIKFITVIQSFFSDRKTLEIHLME